MTNHRLQVETQLLEMYFPKKYRITQSGNETIVDVGVKTQNGSVYQLSIELESDYPSSLPRVYIVYPQNIRDYSGNTILSASKSMHTMSGKDGAPQICHIWPANWNPERSLMQVVMKARVWLEAFESHKTTGKPLDIYLPEN